MSGHQFLKKSNPRRMIGAAMAEYMPILGIGLITAMAGYQQYGDVITDHIGDMAQEMASNYYQGWFYPEGTPGLAAPGGSGRHKDSGGPDDSDGSGGDGSDGDGGGTQPGDGNVPPIDDLFPDPGGGGGGGMCLGPGDGDPGYSYPLGGSSQGGVSTAPTYTVAGNPIDFGTGNKFQVESDFQHYGETPLKFERYYNSRQSNNLSSLGHGWRHSYQRQLSALVDLEGSESATYRKMVRDDGSVYLFRLEQDRWVGQGVVDQLEKIENGWRYIALNQIIEIYNETGQLQSVKYPNGVIHQLTYKNNQLVSVSDSRGVQLSFYYEDQWLSRVKLPNNDILRFQYSETGNLKGFQRLDDSLWSQISALWTQNTATYHYENQQLNHALTGITDAEGKRYATWGYDDLGRANLSEHGNGVERLTFDYRNDGTVAMTNAASLVTIFHLEAARPGYRRLVRVEGKATPTCPEVRQDHQYNEQGYLRLAVDAEGSATEYRRNQRGLVTRQDDGLTRQQGQWLPVEGTSRIERRWHDTLPLVVEETLSRYHQGRWQSYRKAELKYSDAGRLLGRIDTDLTQQTLPYSTYGDQRQWEYRYTFEQKNVGQIATLAINGPRNPLADGSDDITTYRFNDRGLLKKIVNPLGHTITIDQYNSDGQPTQATLANGLKVSLDYNEQGQATQITRKSKTGELSETTEIDYDRNGLVTRLTLPDGSWQSFDYNDARQIIEIRNNWGERINLEPSRVSGEWTAQLVYDSKGNLIRQSERALDSLGRVIKLLGQHGQEVVLAYNKLGNVLTTTEAGKDEKRITRNDYNAISQLTQVIDAMNGSTRFEYGQTGGISEVVAANGAVTRYRYNGFGDTIQVDSPDTGVIVYDYDSAGNKIRAGSGNLRRSIVAENAAEHATGTSIQFEYDLLNRLVAIDYPGIGSDIRYQYDQTDGVHGNGTGQLTSIEDGSGKIAYGYDDFGNTLTDRRSFELNDQSYVYTLSYQYGKAGQLLGVTYPNGQQLNYHYDANRLKGIETKLAGAQKTLVDKVKHQSFSGVSGWRYGNGLWMDRSFDADGRLSALMLASSSQPTPDQTLWEQVYSYDAFDSIESIQLHDGSERHFKYDALTRLTTELDSRVSDEQFYQYDKAGNRTEHRMGEPGQTPAIWSADYLANSNRLQSYGSTQVLLSGAGSTLVETSAVRDRRHIYNRRNQIVATYINFQLTGTYAYNALGQRTHKMTPSADAAEGPVHTVYHYGLSGQLMAETRIDSQTGKETHTNYLWMNRVPVAMTMMDDSKGQQVTYLHTDHLNTPRKATNDQQTIVWQWNSDAFGMGQANPDPDGDGKEMEINLRFAGQYYDHESGLFYNYHRYYDPETGRYSQSDPIGLRGGINTYAYVNSNPLVSTNPLGLFLFAFDGTMNDRSKLETNVAKFADSYELNNPDQVWYREGVGTGDGIDFIVGGLFGYGSRERVDEALFKLDELVNDVSWDRNIDIVGFSRGAAAAREFSNEIFDRMDSNYWVNVTTCNPLNVRFMGLFDTVGSMGLPGNHVNIGYDFRVDSRIGHVAHAVALNEHRALFPLTSVSPVEGASLTSGQIVEQGFIGDHSDIGGGWKEGDLSDIPLQWMVQQAESAGVSMGDLDDEYKTVENPLVHDKRGFLARGDRDIYYPNDPNFTPGQNCLREDRNGNCIQREPLRPTQRQSTAPQFPDLEHMIIEGPQDNDVRGTVDMTKYTQWLYDNGVLRRDESS